jgi:hypothetical protein
MRSTKARIEQTIKGSAAARPRLNKNLILRVPDELHDKLAQMAETMSAEMPGYRVTVSDVARGILEWGTKDRPQTYAQFPYRNAPDDDGKKEGI